MTDDQNGQIRRISARKWRATYRTPLGNILTLSCQSEAEARDWIESMARPAAGVVPTVDQKLSNILRNFHRNTPYPEADGGDIDAAIAAIKRATNVLTDDLVSQSMLSAWNDICDDTGRHPLDIKQLGRKRLTFSPGHWARATADGIRAALGRSS